MVPREIVAGATLLFTLSGGGYPATTHTRAFILNLEGVSVATLAGTPSGLDFIISAAAATTAAYPPGQYFFAELATAISDGTVTGICRGFLTVAPNYAVTATPTPAQLQLAALDANILAVLARKSKSRNFSGQSSEDRELKDLFDARDRLQNRVWAELRALGLTTKGGAKILLTRFCQ